MDTKHASESWAAIAEDAAAGLDKTRPTYQEIGAARDALQALGAKVSALLAEAEVIVTEVEADDRHYYKPANILVNGPLAIEQISMTSRKAAALRVLRAGKPTP